ncbi:Putative monooxygenase [Mycobacteroides abscessus subsp. abscessus]|nr:Putative monooxygenase [Mycobacteroides abscessus subsp. abscessus]
MTEVLIVGAGFAGLGTAIRLLERGIEDFVILERGDDVGGTWRDNSYPGAACDIPSLLYSYSFEQNPKWSRAYSGGSEILGYIQRMVDKHQLRRFIKFGVDVTGLTFDDSTGMWTADTAAGEIFAGRCAVMAAGPLANVSWPDIRGLDSYTGHKIHSARWDHDYDMSGKHVAVIGTGASGVQIIPELVKTAARVKVFQRTPGWVLPRLDFQHPDWAQRVFGSSPAVQNLARQAWYWTHEAAAVGMVWDTPVTTLIQWIAKANLRRQISDPWVRRQLTPDFRAGCKRMLMTSDYYAALEKDNCKLITWPIATLSPNGIRTAPTSRRWVSPKKSCTTRSRGTRTSASVARTPVGCRRITSSSTTHVSPSTRPNHSSLSPNPWVRPLTCSRSRCWARPRRGRRN